MNKFRGFVFTLDMVIALLVATFALFAFSNLYNVEPGIASNELKVAADSALVAMEETGFLEDAANNRNTSAEVQTFFFQVLPSTMDANISIRRYQPKNDGSFDLKFTLNTTTGSFSPSYAGAKRVAIVKKKDRNEFAFVEITVGFAT